MVKGRKGFTLIELLIVIIIIGVLAALAIPQYTNFVEKARAAEALGMISAIKTAEAAYKLESTGSVYTGTVSNLSVSNIYTTDAAATAAGQYWYYGITGAADSYTVTAYRSSRAGGTNVSYIVFAWEDSSGAKWKGNHPGAPK